MPGNAVGTVAIETQTRRGEWFTEFVEVVTAQRVFGFGEKCVRQWLILCVETHQTRDVDNAVVHLTPFGTPRHRSFQIVEHGLRSGQPGRAMVDPCAGGEDTSLHRALEIAQRDAQVTVVEQRRLHRGGHGLHRTPKSNICSHEI
ncbi:hypothetical protein G9444_4923 [Rhodococcus erythropolis]|uniref:Uncharacterized protein n=1 Tax=Rhodococcus erythropolis TaxID=1833 RepID=A0A6G9CZN9_RHOER|nr:hypothetical protein G9444_4923 [Rhodococcus erythropolis]